ncbi:MAG TPA: hypothetical protein VN541_02110 [Tepidisphaeraceae bacterium]|nr:hypothetical protein [Tepidisphaeraceae bacterium]
MTDPEKRVLDYASRDVRSPAQVLGDKSLALLLQFESIKGQCDKEQRLWEWPNAAVEIAREVHRLTSMPYPDSDSVAAARADWKRRLASCKGTPFIELHDCLRKLEAQVLDHQREER